MIMKSDDQIINNIVEDRNLASTTARGYKAALKLYTNFNQMSISELINEAEREENERIRWKNRKIRQRLVNFRAYLYDKYLYSTAQAHLHKVRSVYKYFDIELQPLPYTSTKQLNHSPPLTYRDLPTMEIIRQSLKISTPLMAAIILFISSSGTARAETMSLTINDFLLSVQDYTLKTDIYEVINILDKRNDIIPSFKLRRKKVNEYYYTFCSPEATTAIVDYLKTRKDILGPDSKLFKINTKYLSALFVELNNHLGLGKKSTWNRLRTHMLRKYHASALSQHSSKLADKDIDFLQGRSDSKTRRSYFFNDERVLKLKYAESMNAVTINKTYDVAVDYDSLDCLVEEYDPEKAITPLKVEAAELKKENQMLKEENLKIREEIQLEARKVFEDILRENNIKL